MSGFTFDSTYLNYFRDRVANASDGTPVPQLEVAARFIDQLGIVAGQRVLDVGCSFGRLLPVISRHTSEVFGLDMTYDVIDEAGKQPYRCVVRASAADTNLPASWFDQLVLWGVFDCCDQEKTLLEIRRILKPGGRVLITGKNTRYASDDKAALVAERNAKRKNFPNSFTDVLLLWDRAADFGFKPLSLARFPRRGDFGVMRMLAPEETQPFYEYVIMLERSEHEPKRSLPAIAASVSETVAAMARAQGLSEVEPFLLGLPD